MTTLADDLGAFDYLYDTAARTAKRSLRGWLLGALVGVPLLVVLLVLAAVALVIDTSSAPGEGTFAAPQRGPKGVVMPTPELVARCREAAQALHDAGATGYETLVLTAIAGPESVGCHVDALGDNYPIRGLLCPSHGWFQIRSCPDNPDPRHLDRGTREWLLVPANSARKALEILRGKQGLGAWSTYTNGSYLDWTTVALAATEGLR